jgi:hypothetical protein
MRMQTAITCMKRNLSATEKQFRSLAAALQAGFALQSSLQPNPPPGPHIPTLKILNYRCKAQFTLEQSTKTEAEVQL